MGMVDGGIEGVGYTCGCEERLDTSEKQFCTNTDHKAYPCGCYNIGENLVECTRHIIKPIVISVALFFLGLIGYSLLF